MSVHDIRCGAEFISQPVLKDGEVVIGPKSSLEVLQNLTAAQR